MSILPSCAVETLQVLAPLVAGVVARAEAVVRQRRGLRILRPCHDVLELLRKRGALPAPPVSSAHATVRLPNPVPATFPLSLDPQ